MYIFLVILFYHIWYNCRSHIYKSVLQCRIKYFLGVLRFGAGKVGQKSLMQHEGGFWVLDRIATKYYPSLWGAWPVVFLESGMMESGNNSLHL